LTNPSRSRWIWLSIGSKKCKFFFGSYLGIENPFVWSVDSYDCFDQSPGLYSKVDGKTYEVEEFFLHQPIPINLLGVEMECSSLFSAATAQKRKIPAAALIVVSRTREFLISENVSKNEWTAYGINAQPIRQKETVRNSEQDSIKTAFEFVKQWRNRSGSENEYGR